MSGNSWVAGAFPAALRAEATVVAKLLPRSDLSPSGRFTVDVEGERLTIPYRIYNGVTRATAQLTVPSDVYWGGIVDAWEAEGALVASMAAAAHTRSHDGWARQRALRRLLAGPVLAPWMIPFIVQLVGEYVVQIVDDIAEALPDVGVPGSVHQAAFGRYLGENPEVLRLTRARVASYWDCYYRRAYPAIEDYPGQRLVAAFSRAASASSLDLTPALRQTGPSSRATHIADGEPAG